MFSRFWSSSRLRNTNNTYYKLKGGLHASRTLDVYDLQDCHPKRGLGLGSLHKLNFKGFMLFKMG